MSTRPLHSHHTYVHPLGEAGNAPDGRHVARVLCALLGRYLGGHTSELGPLWPAPKDVSHLRRVNWRSLDAHGFYPTPGRCWIGRFNDGSEPPFSIAFRYESVAEAREKLETEGLLPTLPYPLVLERTRFVSPDPSLLMDQVRSPESTDPTLWELLALACYTPQTILTIASLGQEFLHRTPSPAFQGLCFKEIDTSGPHAIVPWRVPEAERMGRLGFILTGSRDGHMVVHHATPWFLQRHE